MARQRYHTFKIPEGTKLSELNIYKGTCMVLFRNMHKRPKTTIPDLFEDRRRKRK